MSKPPKLNLASIVAAACRPFLLEGGTFITGYRPLVEFLPWEALTSACLVGLCSGVFALLLALATRRLGAAR